MKKLAIGYLNILTFNEKVRIFQDYDKRFREGTLPDNEFVAYYWSLKSAVYFYCKFIKFLYKQQGILFQSPVDVLIRAGKDNLITDSEVWLEYIKWLNYCVGIKDRLLQKEAMIKVLDKFHDKVELMYILTRSPENTKFTEENDIIFREICNQELVLPDNPVNYDCSELLITEYSYKILLDYFKSNPEIKRVWLHGSKVLGTSSPGSDLDLLFDCSLSAWEEIMYGYEKLLIPYFIDGKNIYDEDRAPFVKCAMHLGTKKIYDIKDFQIYWEDGKSFNCSINFGINSLF